MPTPNTLRSEGATSCTATGEPEEKVAECVGARPNRESYDHHLAKDLHGDLQPIPQSTVRQGLLKVNQHIEL